jgi:hypothetical protein
MRFLERVPLGTPYPDVAARTPVAPNEAIASRCLHHRSMNELRRNEPGRV